MAEDKEIEETVIEETPVEGTDLRDLGDEEAMKKNLITIGIGLVVVLVLGGGYMWWSNSTASANAESLEDMWRAESYLHAEGDYDKALLGDSLGYEGFEAIAADRSGTTGGMIAQYDLGITYLNAGRYEDAINTLESVEFSDQMLSSVSKGAIGDAYMQLGDINQAISYYEKAIANSDNSYTCPIYLKKCGLAHEALQQFDAAIAHYERIKSEFPESAEGQDIDKYLVVAQGKKG